MVAALPGVQNSSVHIWPLLGASSAERQDVQARNARLAVPLMPCGIACCRAQGDSFQAEIMRQLKEKQDRAKRKRDMLSRCRCACLRVDTGRSGGRLMGQDWAGTVVGSIANLCLSPSRKLLGCQTISCMAWCRKHDCSVAAWGVSLAYNFWLYLTPSTSAFQYK